MAGKTRDPACSSARPRRTIPIGPAPAEGLLSEFVIITALFCQWTCGTRKVECHHEVYSMKFFLRILCTSIFVLAATQPAPAQTRDGAPDMPSRQAEEAVREKLNAWTLGLAGGWLEGAPIRFATDIARVVDDGDNLHVLPIVTRGPASNLEALLYLKGVDLAIINADALTQFKRLIPNIHQRVTYILSLFSSELHIFVRPEINSLDDLRGRKVNFNTPGTAAAYSGPLLFEHMNLDVEKTFIPHQIALGQMRRGSDDMAAVVFVTAKPVDAFARSEWPEGFKFLPAKVTGVEYYNPAVLTSRDYPRLIPEGTTIETVSVPTILASYNWQRTSDRYRRVARLTEYLFGRISRLQQAGFHPKWKEINLTEAVPGLNRFPTAQEWLDRTAPGTKESGPGVAAGSERASTRTNLFTNQAERELLFREFLEWRRQKP
ncbi:MAG: TAXI family TRAP transporter solute-binding subunit [Acetobacteraceae bacterium]